jgi:TfoX/Sxy family transcriptional regulator of competence genes
VAVDEQLAARLRALAGDAEERRMFGGVAFLAGGHLAVCPSHEGGLLVRVDPEEADALLDAPGTEPMVMRGKPMAGWLRVTADAVADDAALRAWAERGLAFARSLPPKPA